MTAPDDKLHIRPSEGPCDVHGWTTDDLRTRLVVELRAKHGKGGVNMCRECIGRVLAAARARSGVE